MDKYYGNVCELDIIFSFTKAYYILDELLLAGELQESSKKNVLRCISQQDALEDMEVGFFPPPLVDSLAEMPPLSFPHHGIPRESLIAAKSGDLTDTSTLSPQVEDEVTKIM